MQLHLFLLHLSNYYTYYHVTCFPRPYMPTATATVKPGKVFLSNTFRIYTLGKFIMVFPDEEEILNKKNNYRKHIPDSFLLTHNSPHLRQLAPAKCDLSEKEEEKGN